MTKRDAAPDFHTNPLLLSYHARKDEIDAAVGRVFESGRYILGEEVSAFEKEFARYVGVKHGIGVGNGTDAITLALKACGIGPGDEVITVSNTAVATVAAIEMTGATPVLADITPATFTLDPECMRTVLTSKTRAVLPVHLYGHPADMNAIVPFAQENDLFVIEDCAQSHGALFLRRKTGSFGNIAAFSFYPTKNLGAIGDGGMVVTDEPTLAENVNLLRQYGWKERNMSLVHGQNSRLDEIQAAILRVKLRYLDQENIRRREIARIYNMLLQARNLVLPVETEAAYHVYHQYVIRTSERDALKKYLNENGVETAIHYPTPIHQQYAYKAQFGGTSLPITEAACREILSLPMHPFIGDNDAETLCTLINRFSGST